MTRPILPLLASVAIVVSAVGAAHAQPAPATPAATPAAIDMSAAPGPAKFLTPAEVDASIILPPPPEDGSPAAAAEIAELKALETSRTPERLAQAEHDAEQENVTSILDVFGPALDLKQFPATARLLRDVRAEENAASKAAKKFFHRNRPWVVDPTLAASPALEACDKGDPKVSYPSGHATMGYAAGAVLANLMPGNAQIILARAQDYAESRLVCGVHYRRDIEAGHVLATAVVAKLMTKPEFNAELEAARAELTAAHVAP